MSYILQKMLTQFGVASGRIVTKQDRRGNIGNLIACHGIRSLRAVAGRAGGGWVHLHR